MKNELTSQTSKMTIHSRTKPPTLLKNLNNLELGGNDQSRLMSKANSFIELESVNVSANLAAESSLSQDQRYHKQLSSQMTIQLQPEEKKAKNNNQHRASTSSQSKLQNQNLLINEIMNQISSQNLDKDEENKLSKILNSDHLNILYNEMQSQLQKSIKTVSTNSNNDTLVLPEQKKIVQKLSKILELDNNLLRAAVRSTHRSQKSQNSQQQYLYNFETMQQYTYYFPKFNYDKVIKQYNLCQLKRLKEQKITKMNSLKQRRPNICIRSTPEANSKVIFLNYLSTLSHRKFKKYSEDTNPTNISYGISLKSCNKFPNKYQNQNNKYI